MPGILNQLDDNTLLNDQYEVSLTDITLKVDIGYGQHATSIVSIDGQLIPGPGPHGVFVRSFQTNLGILTTGQKLTISTTVYDIRPETNMTSVAVSLTGGMQNSDYPTMQCNAGNDGSVPYYTRILFF